MTDTNTLDPSGQMAPPRGRKAHGDQWPRHKAKARAARRAGIRSRRRGHKGVK